MCTISVNGLLPYAPIKKPAKNKHQFLPLDLDPIQRVLWEQCVNIRKGFRRLNSLFFC